jgi:hypothetical protein
MNHCGSNDVGEVVYVADELVVGYGTTSSVLEFVSSAAVAKHFGVADVTMDYFGSNDVGEVVYVADELVMTVIVGTLVVVLLPLCFHPLLSKPRRMTMITLRDCSRNCVMRWERSLATGKILRAFFFFGG